MLNVRLLTAALLLAGSFTLLADEPVAAPNTPHPAVKSRNKVYSVADLVVPIRNDVTIGQSPPAVPRTCEDRLIDLITNKVQPQCWSKAGGPCVIQFYPVGMGLVVSGPDDVQAEVAATLDSLRKSQDATINVGLAFMTVSSEFLERFGLDKDLNIEAWYGCDCCGPNCCCRDCTDGCAGMVCECGACRGCCLEPDCCPETTPIALSSRQAKLLLDAVKADPLACITDAPRVAMTDGQSATVSSQQQQLFVTGLKIESVDGEVHAMPQVSPFKMGLSTTVHASASADRRSITLHLDSNYTCLENDEVPMSTVHVDLAASADHNRDHSSLDVTHAIQRPKFQTLTIDTDLNVHSGGTILVYGGRIDRMQRVEHSLPLLSKIPGLRQLFTHVSNEPVTEHLLVLVTPQVVCDLPEQSTGVRTATFSGAAQTCTPPACSACPLCTGGCSACPNCPAAKCGQPAECCSARTHGCNSVWEEESSLPAKVAKSPIEQRAAKKAETLVQKYHEACAKGDAEGARLIAREALDLDPECFSKPHQPVPASVECPCKQSCPACPVMQQCPACPVVQPCPEHSAPACPPACPRPLSAIEFDFGTSRDVGCAAPTAPVWILLTECQRVPGSEFPVNSFRLVPSFDPLILGTPCTPGCRDSGTSIQPLAYLVPRSGSGNDVWVECLPSKCAPSTPPWATTPMAFWSFNAKPPQTLRPNANTQQECVGAGCLEPEEDGTPRLHEEMKQDESDFGFFRPRPFDGDTALSAMLGQSPPSNSATHQGPVRIHQVIIRNSTGVPDEWIRNSVTLSTLDRITLDEVKETGRRLSHCLTRWSGQQLKVTVSIVDDVTSNLMDLVIEVQGFWTSVSF